VKKKGQITIFIIVGLVAAVAIGLTIFLTTQQADITKEFRRSVPSDSVAAYDFVAGCIGQTAKDAVVRAGLQGGFVVVPSDIASSPRSYLSADQNGFVKMPLWFVDGEERVPSKEFIASQVSEYISEEIDSCLDNFAAISDRYAIAVVQSPSFTTLINKKDVVVTAVYPIDATSAGKTTRLENFAVALPVKLGEVYDVAVRIMQAENDAEFLETTTIDLMAMNPAIPLNGFVAECSPKQWTLAGVKEELKTTLRYNLPSIRIKNTNYLDFEASEGVYNRVPRQVPSDAYERLRLLWDVGMYKTDVTASLTFEPQYDIDLVGLPNSNGVLSSKVASGMRKYLSFLCMNFFHFTYDVIFPVKVIIADTAAFNGEGFVFQFGFPVLIDDNNPSRQTFSSRQFQGFETSAGFCDKVGGAADIRVVGDEGGYFLNELDGVTITYRCLQHSCNLGATSADVDAGLPVYRLFAPVPLSCTNPFITAVKDGYLPSSQQLTGDSLTIALTRLEEFDLQVVKHQVTSAGLGVAQELADDEVVSISVSSGALQQFVTYPAEQKISFIGDDANYSITALLTLFDETTGGYHDEHVLVSFEEITNKQTAIIHVFQQSPITNDVSYRQQVASRLFSQQQEVGVVFE
jgi:hypothetical protein